MGGGKKVTISQRALVQRLNRVLGKDDGAERLIVKKSRPSKYHQQLGEFYLLNVNRNFVVQTDLDLEELGRKNGVLADWETVES